MSDNNTAIPKEIMDKIREEGYKCYPDSLEYMGIFGYQLRQHEVDELKQIAANHAEAYLNVNQGNIELQSQLKAANETIEELKKEQLCDWCDDKGWFINEEHPEYPKVQQKIDCPYCHDANKWFSAYSMKLEERDNVQSALIHEKEMRSKEADAYNKRIQELETRIRQLESIQETYWR